MVRDERNIDRIFRDTLADAEVDVPELCWNNIQKQVQPKRKIAWNAIFQLAVASVALFLSFAGGYWLSERNNQYKALVYYNQQSLPALETFYDDLLTETNQNLSSNDTLTEIQKNNILKKTPLNKIEQKNSYINLAENNAADKSKDLNFDNKNTQNSSSNYTLLSNETTMLYNALENKVNDDDKDKSGWLIGGQFTPLYSYRSLRSDNADIQNDLYNQQENAVVAFSSGFSIQYQSSNRWSIQSGINYTTYGQSSNMMAEASGLQNTDQMSNGKFNLATSAGPIIPESTVMESLVGGNLNNKENTSISPNIFQDFNYIEIPVWVKYKVLDGKVDFNIFGGINTNLLVNNKVYVEQGNERIFIGKTDNLSPIHYTSTIGLGLEYQLIYNVRFNLEPTFKYSLTPINQNEMIRNYPYAFGIMTGMRFKF